MNPGEHQEPRNHAGGPAAASALQFAARNQDAARAIALGLAFLAYLVTTWLTMLAHEPWRDEAYAWLIARDAGWGEFLRLRAYEGTPALWYLMLMPLAKLGVPYLSMSILNLLLAAGIAALILWRSPFPIVTRMLLVFSYYLFWQYAIEIRLYTVALFLLFLTAAIYRERSSRPIAYALCVALMFNTTIHIAPIAGGLTLAFFIECVRSGARTKRRWAGVAVMATGALLLLAQLRPFTTLPDRMPSDPALTDGAVDLAQLLHAPSEAFLVGVRPANIAGYAACAVLLLAFYALVTKPIPLLILATHVGGLLSIFVFLQAGFTRHHGLLLLGVVSCLWIATSHDDRALPPLPPSGQRQAVMLHVLGFCLLVSLPAGFFMHANERRYDFSGGRKMAEFIRANGLERTPIAAHHSSQSMSVLPYLPGVRFWYAGIGQYGTYIIHNKSHYLTDGVPGTYERALNNIGRAFPGNEPLLVLLDTPLEGRVGGFRLLYKVDATVFGSDEKLFLYRRERG
jgi:hypothetical protein